MREKSLVPTTLPDWPRVTPLPPEEKLILGLGLWAGRYTSTIGVAAIPLRPLAASLGLDPAALHSGIKTLCQERLVLADWDTYEFFVCDWFRFHTFKGTGVAIAQNEFTKISSKTVVDAVSKAAPWLAAEAIHKPKNGQTTSNQRTALPTATSSSIASAPDRFRSRRGSGIVTFFSTDKERAEAIERKYSAEAIQTAASAVGARNKEPVPGLVEKEIEARIRAAEQYKLSAKAFTSNPPVSRAEHEKGLTLAWKALGKNTPKC